MSGTEAVVMLLIFPFLFILGLLIRRGWEGMSIFVAFLFALHLYNHPKLIVQILCIMCVPFIFIAVFLKSLFGK